MSEELKKLVRKVDGQIHEQINSWIEQTQDPAMVAALLVKNASEMSIALCSDGHVITANLLNALLAPIEAHLEAAADEELDKDSERSFAEEGFEARPKDAQVH